MTECRLISSAERDTAKHKFARRRVTLGAAGLYGGSSSRRRKRLAYSLLAYDVRLNDAATGDKRPLKLNPP